MRVLAIGNMYPPHHLGGYEIVWRRTMGRLRARGHDVRILTTNYRHPDAEARTGEDPNVHRELWWYWREHAFPHFSLRRRRELERHNLHLLDRHLGEFRPDVLSWWAMGGMSLSLLEQVRRRAIPAVGFVGDEWMLYGFRADAWQRAFGGRRILGRLTELLSGIPTRIDLVNAATWIFLSETVRRKIHEAGWDVNGSPVVQVGPDHSLFVPRPRPRWRGRLLYAGRIDPRKGIATAVRSIGLLPGTSLTVVGTGDESHLKELQQLAHDLGVAPRVEFLRRERDELPAIYADADALVFPVLWEEPWGVVPLEAMAVGAPVIATGRGGSGEYLRDGDNCLIFSPRDDHRALARAVDRLAEDDALRERLCDGGLTTASRFSEAAFSDSIIDALERAASP